jgi:hypothetical protein
VNWLDQDFPDPRPYPVFFDGNGKKIYQVRISFPGETDRPEGEYVALGELYLFRRDANERISDNMMAWGEDVVMSASHSLTKSALWDLSYLNDGLAGLGLPLSKETTDAEDLMVTWDAGDPVVLELDLGAVQQVGVGAAVVLPSSGCDGIGADRFPR